MAEITDPRALAFSTEAARPLGETIRGLAARLADAKAHWDEAIDGGVLFGSLFSGALGDAVADGVTHKPINGNDVTLLMQNVITPILAITDQHAAVIEKVCTKPLRVLDWHQ